MTKLSLVVAVVVILGISGMSLVSCESDRPNIKATVIKVDGRYVELSDGKLYRVSVNDSKEKSKKLVVGTEYYFTIRSSGQLAYWEKAKP